MLTSAFRGFACHHGCHENRALCGYHEVVGRLVLHVGDDPFVPRSHCFDGWLRHHALGRLCICFIRYLTNSIERKGVSANYSLLTIFAASTSTSSASTSATFTSRSSCRSSIRGIALSRAGKWLVNRLCRWLWLSIGILVWVIA